MAEQLHKKFVDGQVKSLLERYLSGQVEILYILEVLGIGRSRFFELLKEYRGNPDAFSIAYSRKGTSRRIAKEIDDNIIVELKAEKELVENPQIKVKHYNYSYVKDQLWHKHHQRVSLPIWRVSGLKSKREKRSIWWKKAKSRSKLPRPQTCERS